MTGACGPTKPPQAVPCIIKWECPPKFELKKEWCVAAGEESECVGGLTPREMPNPFPSATSPRLCSSNVEDKYYDDSHIPEIPIIPIEEAEEELLNALSSVDSCPVSPPQPVLNNQSVSTTPQCNHPVSQKQLSSENSLIDLVKGLKDSDIVSAVTVVTTAASILQNTEQASSVDTTLLIELLRDPQMVMKLADTNKFGTEVKTRPEPSEPSSQEFLAISNPVTEVEFVPISHGKDILQSETAFARGKAPAGIMPISSPKQLSPLGRSNSGMSLAGNLIIKPGFSNSSRINIGEMKPVSSLTPPILETNLEMIKGGFINKYGAPLIRSTSKRDEEIEKVVHKYTGHYYNAATSESYMMDPHLQCNALTGVAERYPFPSTPPSASHMMDPYLQSKAFTGVTERYLFPSVTNSHSTPMSKDIEYLKSLIKEHGEARVNEKHKLPITGQPSKCLQGPEFAPKFEPHLNYQMPNMYNGPYQHFTSQPWSTMSGPPHNHTRQDRVGDAAVGKRMKLG